MSTNTTTPGTRIDVTEWRDIDDVTDRVTDRQKQLVKTQLNDELPHGHAIVWLPEFITHDKDLTPIEGDEQLYAVLIEDYSADAWAAIQDVSDEAEYLPKSWTVVFRRGEGFDRVESEQTGLAAF